MSSSQFVFLFAGAWLCAMAYGLCAFRLLARVRHLKQSGAAAGAPDPLTNPLEVFSYVGWLVGGRYGEIDDPVVRRWAPVARALFVIALPLVLAVFAVAFTNPALLD